MEERKKVELLAPAGNYESFLGAVHAGADAVYLGGEKFGARAYADNFTTEQLCSAIQYAHLFGRKIYLTLNTLVKEKEMPQLYDYLFPFYEAGLDGVIIQDMGVFFYVKEHFPDLPLHVSTQMTITGMEGVRMLKEAGAERIVPARELSLEEISLIKREADLEIETFIHGAMCYCYSGQCLFSSILGGRSGNRGKCAQPCRLPYQIGGSKEKALYYLSLKDMCTIEMLPSLIEAGIDSLKIEGRMKKPEYVAGVTAFYRKYIDLYYACEDKENFFVEQEDKKKLSVLYIRSEVQDGYYNRHNGASMVTKDKPGYNESDEKLLKEIRENYLGKKPCIAVTGEAFFHAGKAAVFCVEGNGVEVTVKGTVVQSAIKQPMTEESIRKQLEKCGGTPFWIKRLHVETDGNAFMPLKELNEIRRQAFVLLEEKIIEKNGHAKRMAGIEKRQDPQKESITGNTMIERKEGSSWEDGIYILVRTGEQLKAVADILEERAGRQKDREKRQNNGTGQNGCLEAVFISTDLLEFTHDHIVENEEKRMIQEIGRYLNGSVFAACPYVMRAKDRWLVSCLLREKLFAGILVRNMEEFAFLQKEGYQGKMITDAGLYVWNKKAAEFYGRRAELYTLPFELNSGELKNVESSKSIQVVYGRIPMMITANCIRRTDRECIRGTGKDKEPLILKDRYGKEFPVVTDCRHCYNTIYNSIPLSLHKAAGQKKGKYRLDFTIEDERETKQIIEYFCRIYVQAGDEPPYRDYTNGHSKRGVD